MKFFIFLFIFLSIISIYAKKVDRDSIRIEKLDVDENFFNNLQKIRDELEQKEQKSERKKVEIEELKKDILKREKEIKTYEKNITDTIKSFSTKKSRKFNIRVAKLTKVFETMKAKNVAKIIENLPDDLVIAVFLRLKDENIGKIMKYLKPKKAASLSEQLTEWKKRYKLKNKKK